jgi:hypothetical protein
MWMNVIMGNLPQSAICLTVPSIFNYATIILHGEPRLGEN